MKVKQLIDIVKPVLLIDIIATKVFHYIIFSFCLSTEWSWNYIIVQHWIECYVRIDIIVDICIDITRFTVNAVRTVCRVGVSCGAIAVERLRANGTRRN